VQLSDGELNEYIRRVLFFGPEEKKKYEDQITFLKETLTRVVNEYTNLGVIKINQAGSWRKGTALKPIAGQDIDIDLIVYLSIAEARREDLANMHAMIVALLHKAYPTKPREDFKPNPKTVGIVFRTSGLLVDLVPVISVAQPAGYVWQPEQGGGGTFLSSPTGQLEFVRSEKESDPRYIHVVRLAKRWRNYAELDLSSFTIELIVAHLNQRQGPPPTIEFGFLRFLLFLVQSDLRESITFPGAIRGVQRNDTSPVRIHDPTNNENNVTLRMTEAQRAEIVRTAEVALQSVNHAMSVTRKGDTEALWKSILGPQFSLAI
jgi:tRNA nucleotidyltransferase (CCA-adding enzyme)